jgi:L-threonine kinase
VKAPTFNLLQQVSGVDTATFRASEYSRRELNHHAALVGDLSRALITQDIGLLRQVATESAAINQRYLKKSHWSVIRSIAADFRAAGMVATHTGTICAFLFKAGTSRDRSCVEELERP